MNIQQLINRTARPAPWAEGDNIPWNDAEFSRRMLNEHLSQEHDAASRRLAVVDQHVSWIHADLLGGRPARILDLGCGPGLYAERLARLGHTLVGIDYGPASLEYARQTAQRDGLACTYQLADIRRADYGAGFDLVMQIYGETNVFSLADANLIVGKACQALNEGGQLLLEVHDYALIQRLGQAKASWYTAPAGLFSDQPYLYLEESWWDEATQTTTVRMYVVDGQTAEVTRYAQTLQAYQDDDYVALLERNGFEQVQLFPVMGGDLSAPRGELFPILGRKQ